jgi:general stress protein 26
VAEKREDAIRKLHELVEDIQVAMMTTRRPDGRLVSRPMAAQEESAPGADFWFVTARNSDKERLTGEAAEIGEAHEVSGSEVRGGRS